MEIQVQKRVWIETAKLMSYQDWLKAYPEMAELEQECTHCLGQGSCPYCHADCEICHGTGTINGSYQAYLKQLGHDKVYLTAYLKDIPVLAELLEVNHDHPTD